jgi:hypothetical protein
VLDPGDYDNGEIGGMIVALCCNPFSVVKYKMEVKRGIMRWKVIPDFDVIVQYSN